LSFPQIIAGWIVVLVADINELKFEVGILAGDSFGAPANTHLNDIQTFNR
jgi:hypothetical protein